MPRQHRNALHVTGLREHVQWLQPFKLPRGPALRSPMPMGLNHNCLLQGAFYVAAAGASNSARSRACVTGLQLTYTRRRAVQVRSHPSSGRAMPARPGSATMMSGCNDPSAEEGTALSRSATRKKAFVTPLAAALASALATALADSSKPCTTAASDASAKPKKPAPQNKSTTISCRSSRS
eukprot:CAMPEP_0206148470 /NCGR_PEP_ID=MMETSP1473-20131121/36729_1 /ASSEMBLY_ACC=CAM_ASM_001109 /TAXON_ID=1461547 /ORGANISM="Stichococcus sp, Strain RCC1054" /LENGTH=179 /DNA_ID=CAMNT_0053545819 /DNA_START=54 /DNA_END=591 /DNA_ORIENTATION=-